MKDLTHKTAAGVAHLGLASVCSAAIQVFALGVLARRLSAVDLGVATLAIVIVRFGQENAALGLETTIVQNSELTEEHTTGCFWVATGSSVAVWLAYLLVAPYVASGIRLPALGPAIRGVSGVILITCLGMVPRGLLERQLAYDKIALLEGLGQAVSYTVAILLALTGSGVWAPLIGFLAGESLKTLSFWVLARWHPRGAIWPWRLGDALRFGSLVTGDRLLTYLALSVDRVIIARLLGAAAAGYYALAFEAIAFPSKRFGMLVARVLFPTLSQIKSQRDAGIFYINAVRYLALFTVPALVGLAVVAPQVAAILYGSKAEFVAPLLRILCIPGIAFAILSPSGSLLYGKGRPDISVAWSALTLCVVAMATVTGARWGIVGAALGVAVAWVVLLPVMEYLVARVGRLPLSAPYRALAAAVGAAVCVGGGAGIFQALSLKVAEPTSPWVLAGTILAGLGAFITFVCINERPLATRLLVRLRPGGSPC